MPHDVLYIAGEPSDAGRGAGALERVDPTLRVRPATPMEATVNPGEVDCAVFVGSPDATPGPSLADVREAIPNVPLVVFADPDFHVADALELGDVDGYVRRETDGYPHLADEIRWVCGGDDIEATDEASVTAGAHGDLAEQLADGVLTVDRSGRIGFANDWVGELLGVDAEGLNGMPLDALEGSGILTGADVEALVDGVAAVLIGREDHVEETVTMAPRDHEEQEVIVRIAPHAEREDVAVLSVRRKMTPPDVAAELRRRRAQFASLHALSTALVACRDRERVFEQALEAATELLEFDGYTILIEEEGWLVPAASTIEEGRPQRLSREEALARAAVGDQRILTVGLPSVVETVRSERAGAEGSGDRGAAPEESGSGGSSDVTGSPVTANGEEDGDAPAVAPALPVEEWTGDPVEYDVGLCVPIGSHGAFQAVADLDAIGVTAEHLELAEYLCATVDEALTRIVAEEELRQRREAMARLHAGSAAIVAAEDVDTAGERALDVVGNTVEFDAAGVALSPTVGSRDVDEGHDGELVFAGEDGGAGPLVLAAEAGTLGADGLGFDESVAASVLADGRPWIVRRGSRGPVDPAAKTDGGSVENGSNSVDNGGGDAPGADGTESTEGPGTGSTGVPSTDSTAETGIDSTATGVADPTGAGTPGRRYEEVLEESDPDEQAILCVPIEDVGVVQVLSSDPGAFDEADVELLELLASHLHVVLRRLETEAQVVYEHDRLSALFDNVPDPAVRYEFVGEDAIVRDVNRAFEDVFGYDRDDVVDADVDEYIVPVGGESESSELRERLMAGETHRTETRRQTVDDIRDFLIHVVPLEADEDRAECFAIYSDITEQKRSEREVRASAERLEEVADIVSHDLRNPLNVARGYLELAENTGEAEHFEEIEEAHDRLGERIEELRSLARRRDVITEMEPVGLHHIARSAWSTVRSDNATLELGADTVLDADKERLREVLENLLRNAIEHGAQDGSVTVRVGATRKGFFVADDGEGIPVARRERVFESGYTTDEEKTGFGLSVVREIAQAHGWKVAASASRDGGARFEFTGVTTDVVAE